MTMKKTKRQKSHVFTVSDATKEKKSKDATADDDAPEEKVRVARQAIRELFDDIRLAKGCKAPTGFMARENTKKNAKLLWSDFLHNASHRVRSVITTQDVSLEALMESIRYGFPLPNPEMMWIRCSARGDAGLWERRVRQRAVPIRI